jgi:hypothetical protein
MTEENELVATYEPAPEIDGNTLLEDPGISEAATSLVDGILAYVTAVVGDKRAAMIKTRLNASTEFFATADQAKALAVAAYKAGHKAGYDEAYDGPF